MRVIVSLLLLLVTIALLLGVVYISTPELASGEMAGQWALPAQTQRMQSLERDTERSDSKKLRPDVAHSFLSR